MAPLLFTLVLGTWALVKYGPDASVLIRLVLALLITVLGILVGTVIDARSGARETTLGTPSWAMAS